MTVFVRVRLCRDVGVSIQQNIDSNQFLKLQHKKWQIILKFRILLQIYVNQLNKCLHVFEHQTKNKTRLRTSQFNVLIVKIS